MDSAADGLLALSNTAAALAAVTEPDNDDRSSSLSELDDGPENIEQEVLDIATGDDGDSEAETERLEESPDKAGQRKPFGISPSKLAQSVHIDDHRPEIESLTDSEISSISSSDDSMDEDGDSEGQDVEEEIAEEQLERQSPNKRKREDDEEVHEDQERSRRRRTGSIASADDARSDSESEDDNAGSQHSREPTVELDLEAV